MSLDSILKLKWYTLPKLVFYAMESVSCLMACVPWAVEFISSCVLMFLTSVVQEWLRSEEVSCNDPAFTEVCWIDVMPDMCCMISSYLCVVGHKALKALQRSLLELQDLLLYQNPETRTISQGKTWDANRYQIFAFKIFFLTLPHSLYFPQVKIVN